MVFQISSEVAIAKNNSVGVLPNLGRSYIIAFQLFINTNPTVDFSLPSQLYNIIHFTTGNGHRTPALWIHAVRTAPGTNFRASSAINGNYIAKDIAFATVTGKWYNIEISQLPQAEDGKVIS